MRDKILSTFSFICAALTLMAAYSASGTVYILLEEESEVAGGGLPYAVGFFLSGLSFSICLIYFGITLLTGWNSKHALSAVQASIITCLASSIISSIWFIEKTSLFNIAGVIGILVSSVGAYVSFSLLGKIKGELQCRQ